MTGGQGEARERDATTDVPGRATRHSEESPGHSGSGGVAIRANWSSRGLRFLAGTLDHWQITKAVGQVIGPCRFSLLSVALGALSLLVPQQANETFRILVLDDIGHLSVFAAAALLWAHNAWYFARVLLLFRYHQNVVYEENSVAQRIDRALRVHLPRLLGILPLVIISLAFATSAPRRPLSPRLHFTLAGMRL